MIVLKMNGITPPDRSSIRTLQKRKYRLYHYGRTEYFGSKREAMTRQHEINYTMGVNATAIGALASEVYAIYRTYFFRITDQQRERCKSAMVQFDRSLHLMVSRSHYQNGTTFTFKHYIDCAGFLKSVLNILGAHSDTNRQTFARHRVNELTLRNDYLINQVSKLLGPSEN